MRKAIDLTGQRFGRLVAIADVGNRRSFRLWQFRCDCGSVIERTSADVRHGKVSSCGCLQRELSSERNSSDLSGRVFGRLTVLRRVGANRHRHVVWECSCQCGASATVPGVSLLRPNGTRSCGCLQREAARALRQAAKQAAPVSKTREYRKALRSRLRERPEHAMAERIARMLSHALGSVGAVKSGRTFDLLGYSPHDLRVHLERQFAPGMTWRNRRDWHIDHVVPISSAKCEADVVALNQLSNLRPLWKAENLAKHDRRELLL